MWQFVNVRYVNHSKTLAAVVIFMLRLSAMRARGAVTYQYVTDFTSYTVAANGTLTIDLYLQETVNAGSVSLLTSEGGLEGAGILVSRTTGSLSFAALSEATPNTQSFSGPSYVNPVLSSAASFTEGAPFTSGVTATAVPGDTGVSRILLGSVTVTTMSGGLNTTFTLSPYVNSNSTIGGNTLTNTNFYDLDTGATAGSVAYSNTEDNPYSFTVDALPEPAVGGPVFMLAMLLSGRRARARSAT